MRKAVIVGVRVVPFVVVIAGALWVTQNAPLMAKLEGRANDCSWYGAATAGRYSARIDSTFARVRPGARVDKSDGELDHVIGVGPRPFWVERGGKEEGPAWLVSYLIAEHETDGAEFPSQTVQRREYVMDVGAHCGVFTDFALRHGAEKVYAVEPDPDSVEALRRNFAPEISSGKVVVIPKGAWSSDSVLPLGRGELNSGTNSVVMHEGQWKGNTIDVPLTTIDKMMAEYGIPRLDFIKMDIEGAEREALKGAAGTLRQFSPRLMLDSYHRPDDMPVFRSILTRYDYQAGGCEVQVHSGRCVPHVTFWTARS